MDNQAPNPTQQPQQNTDTKSTANSEPKVYEEKKSKNSLLLILLILLLLIGNAFLIAILLSESLQDTLGLNSTGTEQEDNSENEDESDNDTDTQLDPETLPEEGVELETEEPDDTLEDWEDLVFTTSLSDFSNIVYKFTMRVPQGTTAAAGTGIGFEYQTVSGADFSMNFSSAYEGYTEGYLSYEELELHGQFATIYRVEAEPGVYKYTTDTQVGSGLNCGEPFPANAPCGSPLVSDNANTAFRLSCTAATPAGVETCDLIVKSMSVEIVP